MVDSVVDLDFPVWGLLPKQETGIVSFLKKYPEYDGRNINIAIFDSGVDPGAPGLQFTSTGQRKVVERFDCSGCGDVNTSKIVTPDDDGCLTGLTGRKLKIPISWKNESNEYHIGIKNLFELYPSKLKERIETERKEKQWDPLQKTAIADVTRELQKIENASPKKNCESEFEQTRLIFNFRFMHTGQVLLGKNKILPGITNLSIDEVMLKEDVEFKVEYLTNFEKKFVDLGPVCDCVVFNNGDVWQACVDTSESGDLENGILLGEYSKTQEFSALTKADQLNISINVHDDGNVLEIVSLCSGHGTHVASIAAAYFPNNPEKNGAAPGAQIISLTVGDGRLGSMETGTALVRAMIKVMELQKTRPIHVINMSYGEHANWSNTGRVGELMVEIVNKYGVTWVASAGNHGPALCTVGTPPDISQNVLIGVGAYVSPNMMVAEYSLRQKLPGMAYTWTSRGPTIDGDLGVSVCAPGAAITSVPNFTLRNSQLLNGTSMSAPHVAGAVSLLLSGLSQRFIPWSPYILKRTLENTAQYLEHVDQFAQGHGLLQVERAFESLLAHSNCPARDVRFAISCGNTNSKGIHIRKPDLNGPIEYNVTIEPCFEDSGAIDPSTKINFSLHLALVCNSDYIQCPAFLDLQNLGRTISVKVDPSSLAPGVHYTSIKAFDTTCVEKGPLFHIPVTIVKPTLVDPAKSFEQHWKTVAFAPNTMQRHFVVVPDFATWGVLRLRGLDHGKQGRFIVHCMQIRPKQSCKAQEFQKMVQVTSYNDTLLGFQLKGGLVLELVIAKYWANLGDITVDYSLFMHGIKPDNSSVTMQAVDGLHLVELKCLLTEEIAPVITLRSSVQVLRPTDSKLGPLTKRDVIPIGRQIYELVLNYEFHISKSADVMPNCPLLSDVLYESEFESQLWLLFNSNKEMLAAGDAYASKYTVKLERGDYVLKLHMRHDKKDFLEKFTDLTMLLSKKLSTSLSLDVYSNYLQAITQGKKMVSLTGTQNTSIPVYISPVCSDKTKLNSLQGQYLTGTISYAKDEYGKRVDVYPFKFVPLEPIKKPSTKNEKEKTKLEEYNDSLRDLKTSFLSKLEPSDEATALYEELNATNGEHLVIHTAMMQCLDPMEPKKQLPLFSEEQVLEQNQVTYNKIISIADTVINAIDTAKLLSFLAIKNDQRNDATKVKSAMERQKVALIDSLTRKGIALCRLFIMDKTNEEMYESIKSIWNEVCKFADPYDVKLTSTNIIYFVLWHATVYEHYGRVLKFLGKLMEEKPQKEIDEKFAEVCGILGWDHCVQHINKSLPIKYPVSYRPF